MAAKTDDQLLAEAKDALHKALIGRNAMEISVDGRKVIYNSPTIDEMRSRVAELEDKIAGRCSRPGAIGFLA